MAEGCKESRREYRVVDDGMPTETTREQERVEGNVAAIYSTLRDVEMGENVSLLKNKHAHYLSHGIRHLSSHFECLDASKPWLVYWIIQSMRLLEMPLPLNLVNDVIDYLSRCQAPTGGFGGGPGQLPHLAPTYAAILSLCSLGTEDAYNVIDRAALQRFLFQMHQKNGSFIMHVDGEEDVRGTYCALVVAALTNTHSSSLFSRTAEWIASCQTYEGGFSAVPGTEAHGGYSFCGFAALSLLKEPQMCDVRRLLRWVCRKQMSIEGGFQGRTNKLVDGCYSFWQGGLFPLLHLTLLEQGEEDVLSECWLFNQEALQEYILYCCQHPRGGLLDKPGRSTDFYHTCYCLSGLSVAQRCYGNERIIDITQDPKSILQPTHPTFNIVSEQAKKALQFFSLLPAPQLLPSPPTKDPED